MTSVSEDDDRSPIEQALEVCVYAPLGFALEARSLLPRFVERGRNQVVLARIIGKYAVARGAASAEVVAVEAQDRALTLLRQVGVLPDDGAHESAVPDNGSHPATTGVDDARPVVAAGDEDLPPVPDVATLAIPDYDSLSASQVVPRLESLAADELDAVRDYEAGTRGRKTILNKITQLQAE